jgi:hypothetical protein
MAEGATDEDYYRGNIIGPGGLLEQLAKESAE